MPSLASTLNVFAAPIIRQEHDTPEYHIAATLRDMGMLIELTHGLAGMCSTRFVLNTIYFELHHNLRSRSLTFVLLPRRFSVYLYRFRRSPFILRQHFSSE